MAETQKGGVYRVGDKYFDANGKEVKLAKDASTEPAADEQQTAEVVYVEGVKFGSAAAGEAAQAAGLTAEDFMGYTPSGQEGYTKPDIAKVVAAKEQATKAQK